MLKIDENKTANLALICDEAGTMHRYVPLEDATALPDGSSKYEGSLLKQAHYCARVTPAGLVIGKEADMLPGWTRYDELRGYGRKNAHG